MSDPQNLNSTPGSFNQATQLPQAPLTPGPVVSATPSTSAPPATGTTVPVPISTPTAGTGSSPPPSQGLGGGVSTPSPGLGGGVSDLPPPVVGDSLLPGTPGPATNSTSSSSSSGSGQAAVYATPADLPAITASNLRTQAVVTDIGNGTSGLYIAIAIGPPSGWSFVVALQ